MRNLIYNDISRCANKQCPHNFCCSRFLQRRIDEVNKKTEIVSVTDFKHSEITLMCDFFIKA
jgi:hypothetical protein